MKFEWDKNKSEANLQKHGISFDEAKTIFYGHVLTIEDKRKEYGEARKISIGELEHKIAVAVVIHTDRKGKTRIISARIANKKERTLYYEYLKEKS
jgi:uncharacterized DUF497 family protein